MVVKPYIKTVQSFKASRHSALLNFKILEPHNNE